MLVRNVLDGVHLHMGAKLRISLCLLTRHVSKRLVTRAMSELGAKMCI